MAQRQGPGMTRRTALTGAAMAAAAPALTVLPTFFLKETTTAANGANYRASDLLFGWLQRLMQPGILRFAVGATPLVGLDL